MSDFSDFTAAYAQLGKMEQLIIIGALSRLASGQITMQEYDATVRDQIAYHRNGGDLRVSQLTSINQEPKKGCKQ